MNRQARRPGTVVITGVTGFLGSQIAARLLERDDRSLLCFVRASSSDDALRRGREAVAVALGRPLKPLELSCLRCVRGDIETAYFGLAPTVHDSLAAGVEEIFHCAASTRLDRPLREARWTNVRGVQTVYAFAVQAASQGGFRRLHHVSSAYVVGNATGSVKAEPLPVDDGHPRYRNTYEQTKAEAELWLQSRSLVPTTVYRPTVIVGDSSNGWTTSRTAVHYAIHLMASDWLRFVPGASSSRLDCVPGDFVADAILALGSRDDSDGEIYHITAGDRALSVYELVTYAYEGIARHLTDGPSAPTKVLGPLRWRLLSLARKLMVTGRRRRALDKYENCEPYTRLNCVFENERERRLLAESGVWLPAPATFFPRTVDYALRNDFGRRRARPSRSIGSLPGFALLKEVAEGVADTVRWPEVS
jgi:thioester reductase-like protein